MTRYADPHRCPDCRAHLVPGAPTCPTCALPLRGEAAGRLYATLVLADQLLVTLRSQQLAPAAAVTTAGPPPEAPSSPAPPQAPGRRPGLSVVSVPRILLGLGATCLLVAALVFLAVTWSVLGVGGRTAVLVAATLVTGGLAVELARRELRAAAESLAVVGYGLLALDVLGAAHAGWLGDLSGAGLAGLVGAVLLATGAGGAVAARRLAPWPATPDLGRTLLGAEVVCCIGAATATFALSGDDRLPTGVALLAGVLLAVVVTGVLSRLGLRLASLGSAAVTVLAWAGLAADGLLEALDAEGWHRLWLEAQVWPLLVAAALALLPAALPRVTGAWRVASVAVSVALLTAAALGPATNRSTTTITLVALGVLAGCAVAGRLLPRPWGLAALVDQVVAGAVVLAVGVELALHSGRRVATAVGEVWSGRTADALPPAASPAGSVAGSGWLLPLCVLGLLGTALALAAASRTVERALTPVRDPRWVVVPLVASLVAAAGLYAVPLWTLTAADLTLAAGATAAWLRRQQAGSLLVVAGSLVVALLPALHAEALTAGAAAGGVVLAVVVQLRGRDGRHAAGAGALLAVAAAGLVWTCGWWWDVSTAVTATVGLVGLVALALLAPYTPGRWWAADRPVLARTGSEVGAAAAGAVLAAAGVTLAPVGDLAWWAAVLLTVGGVGVTGMSLLRRDRAWLRPIGGLLLVTATWVRLWDLGITAPEPYTLPAAVVLLVIGLHRLRGSGVATVPALGPGLFLALTPSLLWVLDEPAGPRALVLGLACLLLVLAGGRWGWTAPLIAGAAVGALLVVRLAAPYIDGGVPRWVLIGAAGALLVAVGSTWERRLTEVSALLGYVRRLR